MIILFATVIGVLIGAWIQRLEDDYVTTQSIRNIRLVPNDQHADGKCCPLNHFPPRPVETVRLPSAVSDSPSRDRAIKAFNSGTGCITELSVLTSWEGLMLRGLESSDQQAEYDKYPKDAHRKNPKLFRNILKNHKETK